jgi:hypothetical protein
MDFPFADEISSGATDARMDLRSISLSENARRLDRHSDVVRLRLYAIEVHLNRHATSVDTGERRRACVCARLPVRRKLRFQWLLPFSRRMIVGVRQPRRFRGPES